MEICKVTQMITTLDSNLGQISNALNSMRRDFQQLSNRVKALEDIKEKK